MSAYVVEKTPDGKKWQVKEVGKTEPVSVHNSQSEASAKMKELLSKK